MVNLLNELNRNHVWINYDREPINKYWIIILPDFLSSITHIRINVHTCQDGLTSISFVRILPSTSRYQTSQIWFDMISNHEGQLSKFGMQLNTILKLWNMPKNDSVSKSATWKSFIKPYCDIKNELTCRFYNNNSYILLNGAASDNECVLVEILKSFWSECFELYIHIIMINQQCIIIISVSQGSISMQTRRLNL